MKKLALLLPAFFTASLLATSVVADPPPAALGPRPGTDEAMRCLVRQGPKGCQRMFVGEAWMIAMSWVFDNNADRDFKRGPLVSSTYWGRASESNMFDVKAMRGTPTREMDIFDIKFAHTEYTFYISPADDEGNIRAAAILLYAPHDPFQISGR